MQTPRTLTVILALTVFLVCSPGCGQSSSSDKPQKPAAASTTLSNHPTPSPASKASASVNRRVDLASLKPCGILSREEVEPVFGTVRGEPREDVSISGEKGCTYRNLKGNFADIVVYEPEKWKLQKVVRKNVNPVEGMGDEAFWARVDNTVELWVLLRDRAVVEVRVSTKDLEQARKLAQRVIDKLP